MRARGVPYRILGSLRVGGGDELATLSIEPGVRLRFERGAWLYVEFFSSDQPATGALRALGSAAEPIYFTSAQAAPAPDDWGGIKFNSVLDPSNRLDHVVIEYAGSDCSCVQNTCSTALVDGTRDSAVHSRQPSSLGVHHEQCVSKHRRPCDPGGLRRSLC